MLNQVQLVGRVKKVYQDSDKDWYLVLEVTRSFKDFEGSFQKDYLKCKVWRGVESLVKYCQNNQFVSVCGRLNCLEGETIELECTYIDVLG